MMIIPYLRKPREGVEHLVRLQRWLGLRRRYAGTYVRIWSNEHEAYWRANASGYCTDEIEAGVYAFEDAWERTKHCDPEKRITFRFVNVPDQPRGKPAPQAEETPARVVSGGLVLHLVLTHHWYDETERGAKYIEYRAMTDRWRKQIWERRDRIAFVRFARGYTSRTIIFPVERIDIGPCPIPGWAGEYYRIHFLQNNPAQTPEGRSPEGCV